MIDASAKKKKMGLKKVFRATAMGALVVVHGVSDDILYGLTPKKSNDVKKSKSKESIALEETENKEKEKHKKRRRKKQGGNGRLVVDAVPSRGNGKKNHSPTDTPSLDELYGNEDDCEKEAYHLIGIPKVQIEDCSDDDDECDGNQYMVDEEEEEEEEDEQEDLKKVKRKHDRSNSNEKTRGGSAEGDNNFSYQALSNSYYITNSKDIHIGPYYEQKLIINGIDQGIGRRSQIKETKEIKAIKANGAPLTPEQISLVSSNVGHAWYDLGRKLGYKDGQLEQFDMDNRTQKEKVYQLLRDWIQVEDDKATCAKLCKILWEVDARAAVEVLAIHAAANQNRPK